MLQDVMTSVPDRGLRSLGLQRVSQTYGALHALLGFAVGLLIGAGLALLLAPISGPELRRRVQERMNGDENSLPAH
jgi:YtxH-like protein